MSIFSKLSGSKAKEQKLQEEKKQKAKAGEESKPKYMHTPQHAYVDSLNCVAGASPGNTRESIREAAERRKSRLSQHSSRTNMHGLHSAYSSSTIGFTATRAMALKDQAQTLGAPLPMSSMRKSYTSSPLASSAPSTAGPSTVSSYDHLDMANLHPAPLRPSPHRRTSSLKNSFTASTPSNETSPTLPASRASPTSDVEKESPPVAMVQPAFKPLEKMVSIKSTEVPAEFSSEEERHEKVKKGRKKLGIFWKKDNNHVAIAAA